MKPTAVVINTSRGPVVDEPALIEALQEGRIAGAGLDVFEKEPVDPGNPLLTMDNVVVSPHSAGTTWDAGVPAGRVRLREHRARGERRRAAGRCEGLHGLGSLQKSPSPSAGEG